VLGWCFFSLSKLTKQKLVQCDLCVCVHKTYITYTIDGLTITFEIRPTILVTIINNWKWTFPKNR